MSLVATVTQHSKTTAGVTTAITGMTSLDIWILNVLPEWLSVAALIASLILSFILIRYHLINTKALKLDNEKKELELIELREKHSKRRQSNLKEVS